MSKMQSLKKSNFLSDAWKRVLLYGSAGAAIFALSVALLMPQAIGPEGFILAFGVAAVLVVLFYAMWAGGAAARSMSPAAIKKLDVDPPFALAVLDCTDEPILVYSAKGYPFYANQAYLDLCERAGVGNKGGDRPAAFEQLIGGHPGLSAIAFRLAKAGRAGSSLSEQLPGFEVAGAIVEFTAGISPLPKGQSLLKLKKRYNSGGVIESNYGPVAGSAMLDQAPVGFFVAGLDGKTIYMNDTLREWLGVASQAASPDIADFIRGDGERVLGRRGNAEEVIRSEVMLLTRDNIETPAVIVTSWADVDSVPTSRSVVFGNGHAASPMGVARVMEPAGRGSGQSLGEVFNAAPFGVARLDGSDPDLAIIEDCNPALLQMTSGTSTPGTAFLKILSGDEENMRSLSQAILDVDTPTEVMLVGKESKPAHLYLAKDHAGRTLVYLMDMSGIKELETQLFQAQKMHAVGKLAGGIAHDFNTFLNVIRLNCDDLLTSHPIGDPSFAGLQQINQTVNRAKSLVSQLMAFAHQQTTRVEVLDMAGFLSDVSSLLKQVMQESVTLEVKHSREKLTIRADRRHLETALMNLATNARDAMKDVKGAKLVIQTSAKKEIPAEAASSKNPLQGDWILIEVTDNGAGMSEDVMANIFEPFYTTKEVGSGTGLGLSTVYGIIKQSGGYLHPVSTIGEGTSFQIWLRACDPKLIEVAKQEVAKKKTTKPKKPADLSGRGKILFVEDEPALRSIAAKTLVKRGYEVLQAGDGEEALQMAKDHAGTIDLMISDVVMPNMDGPTMLKEAREYLGDARIVFISGYAKEEFSDVLSKETEVSFLPKPFSLAELATKVKEELSK